MILAVTIWILFKETVQHILFYNTDLQRLVVDVAVKVHAGDVAVEEDDRFHKLILIGLTPAKEDVVAEEMEHRMSLALE